MSATYPETPEAVAWELTLAISEAEGRPMRREQQRRRRRGRNESERAYVLELFAECLAAVNGKREGESLTRH